MATLTYSPLTSRQAPQNSGSGPLTTTAQDAQSSSLAVRPQHNSSLSQSVAPGRNSSPGSQSLARSTYQQFPFSSQSASRITSQPSTPHKSAQSSGGSPGQWKHPQAQEIARRQRASTFGADNVSTIVKSVACWLTVQALTWALPDFVWRLFSPIHSLTGDYPLWLFHASIIATIVLALRPLWTGQDQLLDIDLNATQRSLLGLDPNATPPATPATKYITPPKYARSATPMSGTPGSRGSSPAGSPLAYKDNSGYHRASESFSSSRRASFGSDSRRQSFGLSASVFGTPSKEGSVFVPQTPSPIGRASGINFSNKWLYHKGKSSSMSRDSF